MILQASSDVMKDIPIDALWVVDISGISEEKRMGYHYTDWSIAYCL